MPNLVPLWQRPQFLPYTSPDFFTRSSDKRQAGFGAPDAGKPALKQLRHLRRPWRARSVELLEEYIQVP
jgi:hypothetical protein